MSDQNVRTPPEFFHAVENYYGVKFGVDLAADHGSSMCPLHIPPQIDSLGTAWPVDRVGWLNPPFGKLRSFIDKCSAEAARCEFVSVWPLSGDLNQIPAWTESSVTVVHGRVWPHVRSLMLCHWGPNVPRLRVCGAVWMREAGVLDQIW